jgi:carboxymethylenebutenolidase
LQRLVVDGTPAPLPTAELKDLAEGVSLLPPLSRRGHGPGIIILLPKDTPSYTNGGTVCSDGIPPPLLKWAEEGFAVVQILEAALEQARNVNDILELAVLALKGCEKCHEEDGIGLVGLRRLLPHVKIFQTDRNSL